MEHLLLLVAHVPSRLAVCLFIACSNGIMSGMASLCIESYPIKSCWTNT